MTINKAAYVSVLSLAALLSASNAQATIITYTNKTTFLNMLQAGYWEDPFNDITNGGIIAPSTTRSHAGYKITYSAPSSGLYTTTGAISTNNAKNNLVATMAGTNVFAVGGYFFLTDINGNFQPYAGSNVTAFAANGIDPKAFLSSSTNSTSNFFGWISDAPITSVTMTAGGANPYRWNTLDNVIVGAPKIAAPLPALTPVPEPGTFTLMAFAVIALNRKFLGFKRS